MPIFLHERCLHYLQNSTLHFAKRRGQGSVTVCSGKSTDGESSNETVEILVKVGKWEGQSPSHSTPSSFSLLPKDQSVYEGFLHQLRRLNNGWVGEGREGVIEGDSK